MGGSSPRRPKTQANGDLNLPWRCRLLRANADRGHHAVAHASFASISLGRPSRRLADRKAIGRATNQASMHAPTRAEATPSGIFFAPSAGATCEHRACRRRWIPAKKKTWGDQARESVAVQGPIDHRRSTISFELSCAKQSGTPTPRKRLDHRRARWIGRRDQSEGAPVGARSSR